MLDLIRSIRDRHKAYITKSCRENKCGLRLDGITAHSLAIIHGSRYQRHNEFTEKLCDRIVVCGLHGCIVAAVELKGGNTIHLSEAIVQIQNGLKIADFILQGCNIADWVPILLYSGHMGPNETRLLRTRLVEFRGTRKNVIRRDCNTQLSEVW